MAFKDYDEDFAQAKASSADMAPINETMIVYDRLNELAAAVNKLANSIVGHLPPAASDQKMTTPVEPDGIFNLLSERNQLAFKQIDRAMQDIARINVRL